MKSSINKKQVRYVKPKIIKKQISSLLYIRDQGVLMESNLLALGGSITCGPCGAQGCTPWTCT